MPPLTFFLNKSHLSSRNPGQDWQPTTQWWTPAPTTQWWTPSPTTQWAPTPTAQQWYPTASSQSIWVGTSISTVYVYVTQQPNVVVTMTSYIPCVVTSTVWVYQCQGGCPVTTPPPQQYPGFGTTITITSYTEVTANVSLTTRTVTSGSYVLAIIEAATPTGSIPTVPGSAARASSPMKWIYVMFATAVFLTGSWP